MSYMTQDNKCAVPTGNHLQRMRLEWRPHSCLGARSIGQVLIYSLDVGLGLLNATSQTASSKNSQMQRSTPVPGSCTKYIQAPDAAWNKPFKAKVTEKNNVWMADGAHSFTAAGNLRGLPRREIVKWDLEAWETLDRELIIHSFRSCALLWLLTVLKMITKHSLPKGGSTLPCRTGLPGIHPAGPNSFSQDWPICWRYAVRCRRGSTRKFTYWAERRWHWSWLRIMIAKETSPKTKQWVVSPGLKPNNEQL